MSIRRNDMKLKELLAVVEEIKKDLSYIRSLQERWQKERQRFPILYEYIGKQSDFFREKLQTLFEAEMKEESLDAYVKWRLQQAGKQPGGVEEGSAPVAQLQALESAMGEAAGLRQQKGQEDAKRLAEKVHQAAKERVPDKNKDAAKLAGLGTRTADEIERHKKK